MKDLAMLILRLTFGGLLAGHGGQKLFGWFEGHGLSGTSGWMESMGLTPGKPWALLAGLSEFGGGVLTLFGFLNPLGPLASIGAMAMAATKVHGGKPIWVTSGGAELPVTNMAIALSVGLAGPGKYSLDRALHIKLPRRILLIPGLVSVAATVAYGLKISEQRTRELREAEQAPIQPVSEDDMAAAVPVAERPHIEPMEQHEEQSRQEQEQASSAELQAGQDAEHPV